MLAFVLLLLISAVPSPGQQPALSKKTVEHTYGFVSPNTFDNLSVAAATRKLNSREETDLILRSRAIACGVGINLTVTKSIGSWSDGAEHSLVLLMSTDDATARYVVSSLGNYATQKAVLYFRVQTTGPSRIYILSTHLTTVKVASLLDAAGIAFRTIVPLKRRTLVYVVDLDRQLASAIHMAARKLNSPVQIREGTGAFIGNDDRAKASEVFLQEIKSFETERPTKPTTCNQAASARRKEK